MSGLNTLGASLKAPGHLLPQSHLLKIQGLRGGQGWRRPCHRGQGTEDVGRQAPSRGVTEGLTGCSKCRASLCGRTSATKVWGQEQTAEGEGKACSQLPRPVASLLSNKALAPGPVHPVRATCHPGRPQVRLPVIPDTSSPPPEQAVGPGGASTPEGHQDGPQPGPRTERPAGLSRDAEHGKRPRGSLGPCWRGPRSFLRSAASALQGQAAHAGHLEGHVPMLPGALTGPPWVTDGHPTHSRAPLTHVLGGTRPLLLEPRRAAACGQQLGT